MTDLVVGIDLSLASTGVSDGHRWAETVKWPGKQIDGHRHDRLDYIAKRLVDYWRLATLVVVEGPSYGSQGGQAGHHERAGLWWLVTQSLWRHHMPYAVVSPKGRAKYATGNGNAGKDAVIATVTRRYPDVDITDNNCADAFWLAAMGRDHLGMPVTPVPATHRAALSGVQWPDLLTADTPAA